MRKNFKCNDCVHNNVCKNKKFLDMIQEKVDTRINDIYIPSDSFEIMIRCKYYVGEQYVNLFSTFKDKGKCCCQ